MFPVQGPLVCRFRRKGIFPFPRLTVPSRQKIFGLGYIVSPKLWLKGFGILEKLFEVVAAPALSFGERHANAPPHRALRFEVRRFLEKFSGFRQPFRE